MFEITSINLEKNKVIVEDKTFGLVYEFFEQNIDKALVVNDYQLQIIKADGSKKYFDILKR